MERWWRSCVEMIVGLYGFVGGDFGDLDLRVFL